MDALAPLAAPLQAQHIAELARQAHKQGDHTAGALDTAARALLAPALQGHDVGLLSEAGMPAVADPGSSVVRAAHAMGLAVVPLAGPVSLMLALAASGLNGQHFAFVGYVPQDAAARGKRLHELETQATRSGQTQILIETPYRNKALLEALLGQLQPGTRLAVACALGLPQQAVRSATIGAMAPARGVARGAAAVDAGGVPVRALSAPDHPITRCRCARTAPLSSGLASARSIVASRKPSLLPQS